ncbi:hypothetical protein ACP70R_027831 [Stipagrostis hirtigluma subsp. patula]
MARWLDQKRTHLAAAALSWSVLECASKHPSRCFRPPPPRVACSSLDQKLVAVVRLLCCSLIARNAATASASPTTRSCRISSDTLAARLISSWNAGSPSPGLAHPDDAPLDSSEEYAVETSEHDDAPSSYSSSPSPPPPRTTEGSDAGRDRCDSRSRRQDAQTPSPCCCRLCRRHRAASALPDFAFPIADQLPIGPDDRSPAPPPPPLLS